MLKVVKISMLTVVRIVDDSKKIKQLLNMNFILPFASLKKHFATVSQTLRLHHFLQTRPLNINNFSSSCVCMSVCHKFKSRMNTVDAAWGFWY